MGIMICAVKRTYNENMTLENSGSDVFIALEKTFEPFFAYAKGLETKNQHHIQTRTRLPFIDHFEYLYIVFVSEWEDRFKQRSEP